LWVEERLCASLAKTRSPTLRTPHQVGDFEQYPSNYPNYLGGLRDSFFRRQGQSKYRDLPLPGNIHAAQIFRVRQVQSFAILAAIDLGIFPPSLLKVATSLFDDVAHVIPALEMATAELALLVLLVAGALADFLNLHSMMRELLGSLYHFGCDQRTYPLARPEPPDSVLFILTEGV